MASPPCANPGRPIKPDWVIRVKFTLTDANGQPISDSLAAELAAAGGVKVTLSGPGTDGPLLVTVPCGWDPKN